LKKLRKGAFFGDTNFEFKQSGLVITDTVYTHNYVDWHSHENPYLTFILEGSVREDHKSQAYHLSEGDLLFHNSDAPHSNTKSPRFTRGAHLEIERNWLKNQDICLDDDSSSFLVKNPQTKQLFHALLLDAKLGGSDALLSTEMTVSKILSNTVAQKVKAENTKPSWLSKVEEIIHEEDDCDWTLAKLSEEVDIHPVHLSRTFHQFYQVSFSQFCRDVRLNKAFSMLYDKKNSMMDIACACNYYDHSHMIAAFRQRFRLTPKQIRESLG